MLCVLRIFGRMPYRPIAILVAAFLLGAPLCAQLVGRKNLVIAAGIGGVYSSFSSNLPAFDEPAGHGGNFTLGTGYAFNENWGLGFRWDRSGHMHAFDTLAQARVTLFQLHGIYRPWQNGTSALEIEPGIGTANFSFRGRRERIPVEGRGTQVQLGVRYMSKLYGSILGFCAVRGSQTFPAKLMRGETEVMALNEPATVSWRSVWLAVGLAVRW